MMSIHDEGGCQHADRTKGGIDLVCRCGLSPDAIAESKLASLREAGEKMARMLKYVNDMNKQKEIDLNDDWLWAQNSDTGKKILTALAEWEAANK
jgi:hypothetical protein